jgi:hypothetical protein
MLAQSADRRRKEILASIQRRGGSETAGSGDFEKPFGIDGGCSLDLVQGKFRMERRKLLGHLRYIDWFITLSPVRNRSEIRTVGFDQDAIKGSIFSDLS